MKNKNILLYTMLLIMLLSAILCGCNTTNPQHDFDSETTESSSEIYSEAESEFFSEEESEMETEESTEVIGLPESTPLGYNEKIELEFVETPAKRTREVAIEKIKELSRWYPALYFVYENADKYPLELVLSGAGNPEMVDFLYGYLTAEPVSQGGFTEEEKLEDYPLFLQFDPRWGYMPYGSGGNVGSSGCGPTCLAMAVFALTGDCTTPGEIAQYSLDNGFYLDGIGTKWTLLTNYPKRFGLSSYQISWTEANLKAALDQNRIIICSVRPGDFTSSGHFIVIYGYDENGFKINDPKSVYRSRLSWTYAQIQDDIKAAWSIGK